MNDILPLSQPLSDVPLNVLEWRGRDLPVDEGVRELAGDDDFINREYVHSGYGRRVDVYVGYIGRSRARMGHRVDVCYPAHGFKEVAKELLQLEIHDSTKVPALLYEFSAPELGGGRNLVLTTFLINGQYSSDVLQANSYNTRSLGLLGNRADYVARVQISMRTSPNRVADVALLSDFVASYLPFIRAAMPTVSDQ